MFFSSFLHFFSFTYCVCQNKELTLQHQNKRGHRLSEFAEQTRKTLHKVTGTNGLIQG